MENGGAGAGADRHGAEPERATAPGDAPPLWTADAAIAAGDPVLELRAHVLRAVVAVVPADTALFVALSRRGAIRDVVALADLRPRDDLLAAWARYAAGDDVGAAGWADRAELSLRSSGMVVGCVALLRTERQPRFSATDAKALRQLHALVEHAYVAAVEPSAPGPSLDTLRESGLTAREAEVAELVARGASNADIGRALHLSELTVKTHLTRVYAKVGVQTRTQLAILLGSPG